MKFCQAHWDRLRTAIEIRGLGHLIAPSGAEAMERAAQELDGTATDATYDPLMAAHWMIVSRVTELGGLYLMTGDYCPICEAIKGHSQAMVSEQVEAHYIDGPADAVLAYCRDKGLSP